RRAKRGGYVRFRFLDLWIRFGKIISKVCEGFNSGAKKLDTNSIFTRFAERSVWFCGGKFDTAVFKKEVRD
ncbi:hypothetical protein M1295_00005, partial [Patescibacteria group bacterium]|nr:hypothetical protein [Patescibacteria group bacterium]